MTKSVRVMNNTSAVIFLLCILESSRVSSRRLPIVSICQIKLICNEHTFLDAQDELEMQYITGFYTGNTHLLIVPAAGDRF